MRCPKQVRTWVTTVHVVPKTPVAPAPLGRGNIHKNKFAQRFDDFAAGNWMQLLHASRKCDVEAFVAMHKKRRKDTQSNEMEKRAARALSLVQMGELSSGRQTWEAPGNEQTLNSLRDPGRRPPRPRDPIPRDISKHQPAIPFELEGFQFVVNLRTSDHLRPLLDYVRAQRRDGASILKLQRISQLAIATTQPPFHILHVVGHWWNAVQRRTTFCCPAGFSSCNTGVAATRNASHSRTKAWMRCSNSVTPGFWLVAEALPIVDFPVETFLTSLRSTVQSRLVNLPPISRDATPNDS